MLGGTLVKTYNISCEKRPSHNVGVTSSGALSISIALGETLLTRNRDFHRIIPAHRNEDAKVTEACLCCRA